MSKRLQVVMSDDELRRYQDVARVRRLTLSEWVRESLREAERSVSTDDVERKLAALDWATSLDLGPEDDIEAMLAQTESRFDEPLPGR